MKKLRTLEGSRDHVQVVCNTGVKSLIEYRNFNCGCLSCTTHSEECTQKDYADDWKTFWLLPGKQTEGKPSDWFKPVSVQTHNENNDLMEFEEDIDVDTVNCDELEEENEDNHDKIDDDASDGKQGEGDEHDLQNSNEAQSNVTTVEVADECDIQNANEAQSDVDMDDSVVEVFVEEYESSEYESDYDNSPFYPPEIPTVLSEEDENLSFNWNGVLNDIKDYKMFNALKCYVQCTRLPEVLPIVKYMVDEHDVIDTIAKHFYPDKDGLSNYLPVETIGNRNYGYRALGHVLLSDQNCHHEVRVRITFDTLINEESFLQHAILAGGSSVGSKNRPASYAAYSGFLMPEIMMLNEHSMCTIYQREVLANSKQFTYMGVWQIYQATEAFRHPIGCVYP